MYGYFYLMGYFIQKYTMLDEKMPKHVSVNLPLVKAAQ